MFDIGTGLALEKKVITYAMGPFILYFRADKMWTSNDEFANDYFTSRYRT